jgi:hypothetical protein
MSSRRKQYTFMLAAIMAAITAGVVWTGPLAAQEPVDTVLTAVQLRRLAAAVHGHPGSTPVYVVMSLEGVYEVRLVTESAQAAQALVDSLGGLPWKSFGPYVPEARVDSENRPVFYFLCHDWDSDMCGHGDEIRAMVLVPGDTIGVQLLRGAVPVLTFTHAATDVDAVFFNMAAIDKFMVPYWARVYGIETADSLREAVRAEIERLGGGG